MKKKKTYCTPITEVVEIMDTASLLTISNTIKGEYKADESDWLEEVENDGSWEALPNYPAKVNLWE